jgi:hypothetical protein
MVKIRLPNDDVVQVDVVQVVVVQVVVQVVVVQVVVVVVVVVVEEERWKVLSNIVIGSFLLHQHHELCLEFRRA